MPSYERAGLVFDVVENGPPGGTPVVCLHGFPQDAHAFDDMADVLVERGCHVLAPDQRGYSPRARPPRRRDYMLRETVLDALALLDAFGIEAAHVVGHDWGAVVGWLLAARHPDRVRGLAALSVAHPSAILASVPVSTQLLRTAYVAFFQIPAVPEAVYLADEGGALRRLLVSTGLGEADADRYTLRMREPGALTAALNWYRALPLHLPMAGRARVPTLLVRGAEEPFVTRQAAVLTQRFTTDDHRYVELAGAGHWLPETRAREVAGLVLQAIAKS